MTKTDRKYYLIGAMSRLYTLNKNGEGFRSIGKWKVFFGLDKKFDLDGEVLLSSFNRHQLEYLDKVQDAEEMFVLMKDKYSGVVKVHCCRSFAHWFLANLESAKTIDEWDAETEELATYCYDVLGFRSQYDETGNIGYHSIGEYDGYEDID